MKFTCDKRELESAMRTAMRAVPSKSTMPILECVLIEADEKGITVTANSMDMGLVTHIDGTVHEFGQAAIEAKVLNEISGKLPSGDATIGIENDIAKIKAGRSKFEIPCRDADSFIRLPEVEAGVSVMVDQEQFRNAIQKSIFCISQNDKVPTMTGEKIEVNGNVMRFIALDGHRIAITEIMLDKDYGKAESIVPGRTLSELTKILKEGHLEIEFTQSHCIFDVDGTTLISRVIEGQYFDVSKMMRFEHSTALKVDACELLSCIGRASVVMRDGDKRPVVMEIFDGGLSIDASTQMGHVHEELAAEKTGEDLRIGFNDRFLGDAIGAASSYDDEIELQFESQKSPVAITRADAPYRYIVLPVNLPPKETT